jgi:hypothetical protein
MTFEIPYNREITREQQRLALKLAFKKNLIRTAVNFFCGVVVILMGWLNINGGHPNGGYFFLAIGISFVLNVINYLRYYWRSAKKHQGIYQAMAEVREKSEDVSTWEFGEEAFRYKDIYYDNSIKWAAFSGYKIIERNIFLVLAETQGQSFVLGEKEVGVYQFAKLVDLLKGKLLVLAE